ncbi:MAG: DUF3048 domain-containing protein [Oscillospiraceae bacterium]
MLKKILPSVLALFLLLSACGPKAPEVSPSPSPSPTATAKPTPTPYAGPFNPLTGLPIDEAHANARPIAIMLNNLKQALPQLGTSQADIIYEILAEGGITRMVGVYQSMEGVGNIGSVRSSRPYYLEVALGHDAVYLHAGGSQDAYADIAAWNVTALDCVRSTAYSDIFWRDQDRIKNKGYEHSVLTSGEKILKSFPGYSFRQAHEDGYKYVMNFAENGAPAGGAAANAITVPFSNYKTGVFTYDTASKAYKIEEYGAAYIDGNTNEQVAVTNVLILKTDCHAIDDYGRLAVDLTSGGDGFYACGGAFVPITWSKASRNDQFVYKDAAGNPITLGIGKSYVCIVPNSRQITVDGTAH